MILHYFKLAKQTLLKNRYYTFINVLGLTCGMLSLLIICKYVGTSFQSDKFHRLKDSIYTIIQEETIDGSVQVERMSTYWGVSDLVRQYPEVISATRYSGHVEAVVIAVDNHGHNISFLENKIFVADSSFFRIFSFRFIDGDSRTALSSPNSVVITKSASERYFGKSNAIGKTLTTRVAWGEEQSYEVTGMIDNIPQFSRFNFEFLLSPESEIQPQLDWASPDYSTYVLTREGADAKILTDKLASSLDDEPQFKTNDRRVRISLQPLTKLSMSSTDYLLAVVAIFITVVCWVNYTNHVIAQSHWRLKQVGMFRVMGATRLDLIFQFILESTLVCLISILLVFGIYAGFEEHIRTFVNGRLLPINDHTWINQVIAIIFLVGILFTATVQTSILAGANFRTISKSISSIKIAGIGARKILVTLQFSISTGLLICIFVISRQMEYLDSSEKGVALQNILVVKTPFVNGKWDVRRKTLQTFKERCAELPVVLEVASSSTVPGDEYRNETYLSLQGGSSKFLVHQNGVDDSYFGLYQVEFLAGQNFPRDSNYKNARSVILNESAARGIGLTNFEDAIDETIIDNESGEVFNIVGIVKDYHQTGLKYSMAPTAFKFNIVRGHISIRVKEGVSHGKLHESIESMRHHWDQLYDDAPFDYFLLSERYQALNLEDKYFGNLFYGFTLLSIVLSCVGLFNMSLLISERRQKEIGIRKVLGASAGNIIRTFFQGYLVSLFVAIPLGALSSYWLMDSWLRGYAYKTEISTGLIFTAVISIAVIFFSTVAYHTIRAAVANPVKVLRD